jgi:mannobiose 2-epimerase
MADYVRECLKRTERYLREKLIPFWATRLAEPEYGGFQANYDRHGCRTGVTEKTLLCQARSIFALSHAARMGFEWPGCREMIAQGIAFLLRQFQDPVYGGYYWICEADGRVKADAKVIYGHAYLVYAFAEHALLTGEDRSREEAARLFDLVASRAADLRHGGFHEHFTRAFELACVRPDGVHAKSFDVHMHLMEAFTTLYELTREAHHRRALEQVIDLIFARMIEPEFGVGVSMFAPDWTPVPNVQLNTLWGSDRFDVKGKPPEVTSYGHNIEFAWLYLHSQDILGRPRSECAERVVPIFDHTAERGVDWEHGGLYVEGPRDGAATETNKEFWQQAEALVGFLDAYLLTGDEKYLKAFRNVHDFVFDKMINYEVGEWFPLLDRRGRVLWDYMGHNWKICYHTLRATCQVVLKLRQIVAGRRGQAPPRRGE